MAKLVLSPIVASIAGPAKGIQFYTTRTGKTTARSSRGTGLGGPRPQAPLANPLLISPPTFHADCDAWKVCDAAYTRLPPSRKAEWRDAINRSGVSAYDAYMHHAIPHVLRGYPAPDWPTPAPGFTLHRLHWPADYMRELKEADCSAVPPPSCKTEGVHWVSVRLARCIWTPPDPLLPPYAARVGVAGTFGPVPDPTAYWCEIFIHGPPPNFAVLAWNPWMPTTEESLLFMGMYERPYYATITACPIKRNADFSPVEPQGPDHARDIIVRYLNPKYDFYHWPRAWPTRRRDAPGRPTGWDTWHDDPPFLVYEPLT